MGTNQAAAVLLLTLGLGFPALAQRKPDRYRDSLKGPVMSVRITRMARLANESGIWVEQSPFEVGGGTNYDLEGYGPLGKRPQTEGYGGSHGSEHGESSFDVNGNKSITLHYSGADQPVGKDLYIYDSRGNELEELRYRFDGESWAISQRIVSTYAEGEDLRIAKLTYNGDGELQLRCLYQYDGNRDLIDEYLYSGPQTLKEHLIYKYQLDAVGNWIKRTMYREMMNDEQHIPGLTTHQGEWVPDTVTYREIGYYKGWRDLIDSLLATRNRQN